MRHYLSFWNILGVLVLVLGLVVLVMTGGRPRTQVNGLSPIVSSSVKTAPIKVTVQLYFPKADGASFVLEQRQVTLSATQTPYQAALDQLAAGPRQSGVAVIPAGTPAPRVFVASGTAYVDLPQVYTHLNYGLSGDTLLIYSIANTLLATGGVNEVRFMIGGRPTVNLGPLSLVDPISKSR